MSKRSEHETVAPSIATLSPARWNEGLAQDHDPLARGTIQLVGVVPPSAREGTTGSRVSSAMKIVYDVWQALRLELPAKRRPQLARFFAGFKPLHPLAYGSLLRAMARALIETGHVCARRDAPLDPVELIAAALEVGIEQWDRARDDVWNDVAIRIAAFERLYCLRAGDERMVALAHAIEGCEVEPSIIVEQARREVAAVSSSSECADAMLAEMVIVGRCSKDAAALDAEGQRALPLARAALLMRAERFSEALEACEAILARVPGHTLALQQAARSCVMCGALSQAHVYAKRAAGRVQGAR